MSIKAVVMAGGLGTRMRPALAAPINKHLCPVAGQPLISYPLELLARSGVTDVLILLHGQHPELIMETVACGRTFGLNILYAYTCETHGASVGKHLLLAQHWVQDDPFLLVLGDSVYFLEVLPDLTTAQPTHSWVMPAPDEAWDDINKYAPCPRNAARIQTGIWLFDARVFAAVEALVHTKEVRIRHLVTYLHRQEPITTSVLPPHSFIDCGTPQAVLQVARLTQK